MRVISGKFKYKLLFNPKDNRVRPTTDRIKETLFNILSSKEKTGNVLVLDLFAGSGALGLEALSRGANKAILCDKSYEAIEIIKKNINKTHFEEKTKVLCKFFVFI